MIMLMMLLFAMVLIALVLWAFGSLTDRQHRLTQDGTPLEILRRRYASGEIDQDQFEQAQRAIA
jgi:uncharacterized membrane protein